MSRITLLEMLMNAGLIDRRQFDAALENRVTYGGKIGTSLIELGFVSEEELARFLSRKLSVPYVPPKYLLNIRPEVIALLPRELALKYSAVPLRLDKKRLDLAMADPSDLKAIDSISFALGYIIRPVVAPEVRLLQALGRYYQAPVEDRYLKLVRQIDDGRLIEVQRIEQEVVRPRAVDAEEESGGDVSQEQPVASPAPEKAQPAAAPAAETAPEPAPEAIEDADLVEDDWAGRVEKYAVDDLSKTLSRAEDREDIAAALIDCCGRRFRRCAIFLTTGEAAYGWKAVNAGEPVAGFPYFCLPLDSPSLLKTVTGEGTHFLGEAPESIANRLMRDALGGGSFRSVLLVPIVVTEKVVSVLYIDDDGRDLSVELAEMQKTALKAALAFEMLICREKILML